MTYRRILDMKCRLCGKHIGHVLMKNEVECKDGQPTIDRIIYRDKQEIIDLICDECYENIKSIEED